MIAEAKIGRGDRAYEYYRRINPSVREEISEVHRCEPYVYAQMIAGPDAAASGEAKNSWLTGSAAWNVVAMTQWILGIRPEYEGLRIDPCIPSSWNGFSVSRWFRGCHFRITVHNPQHVCRAVQKMTVDGEIVMGSLIPANLDQGEHAVEVWLGEHR